MRAEGIAIVGASAGSGKTFRLTQEVINAVSNNSVNRIDVESLVAVTFTRKAHSELEARIRHALARGNAHAEALRLPLAYLGTVHAVALRLLQEFAIDAGLSPNVDVVAGHETKLLRQAFERTLDESRRQHLDELAARLELGVDHRARRTDWVSPCADIMDLARANRIHPDALPEMAERSIASLFAIMPPPVADGAVLDAALARELEVSGQALRRSDDGRSNTATAMQLVEDAQTRLRDGTLRWSVWAKLATIAPSKKCDVHVADLRLAAERYMEHPRLHDDLRAMTRAIFEAARAGLVAYQDWKRERRVVDYVDMLDGALTLVEEPRVEAELARRLRLVVVDEFQDTSPIQLALFLRLHALARRSVWVGDRKQCIFEYAGADPVLMDAVAAWVEETGGARDRLIHNYRSRPELVVLSSELFCAALAPHGFARPDVAATAKRERRPEHDRLPPLGLWRLETSNTAEDAEAVAEGVRRLLDAPHETPVLDRATNTMRPLRAGDVAVLAATNDWSRMLADALHARGIRAAIARAGLFDTPEGTLLDAALRWLLDRHDELAAAVLDALTGWAGADPDAWLTARLRRVDPVGPGDPGEEGWRAAIEPLRERLAVLAPVEAVDAAIGALDLVRLCARWPDPTQRIANIDALRAIAEDYEERCAQEREAATVAGLLRYFDDVRTPTLQRDEVLPSDDQHVPGDDGAIVVCTYHKSKGLEWPVVVLANLDRAERRDAFEVTPEAAGAGFDPERPLANRSIRYWPWPLGATKNAPLADRAEASPEGQAVSLRERKERARLLYVGFTRARDHLVLAARVSKHKAKTAWLDVLADEEGDALLDLPFEAADGATATTAVRGTEVRVDTRVLGLGPRRDPRDRPEPPAPRWFARPLGGATTARPGYRITPSAEVTGWPAHATLVGAARIGAIDHFARGIPLDAPTRDYDVLGQAVHGFLATDVPGLAPAERLTRAARLLDGWRMAAHLRAESLLVAGDALRAWVDRRWPGARWRRELPIEGPVPSEHGERWLSGIIDLLLETEEGYVLVDHKSFPAPHEAAWRAKCVAFVPQLAAYSLLLAGTGRPVLSTWIHLPVGGGAVEITFPRTSAPRE
ncbi:MAG: UvrD-helicase domain-containing protein [Labilithrix sp.]|nr:UvrD-helicase domain-containing protein [Labilithrix sp.]MCW5815789.1 UvrD-helicase domain-containing protein [Labilithrix sp.]